MVDVALKALEEAEALEKPEPSSVLSKCTAADVRTADRKLRFCDICGTIFSVHENFRLFSEHFGGKLHLGFMLIREKQKELQEQSKRRKDECEGSLVNERDMDFISNLSDDLLGLIITRLDIHEGARTTILSHRWKSLWQKAPLNFDDKYIKAGSTRERISIVVQVFNKHRGSFRRVIFHHAPFKPLCHWCEVGMFNNLDQISLDLNYENLPECVQCLPLVRSVCLNRCVIKANSYFRSKKLALLELRYCRGAGKFFTFMFSQSENTETLMLVQNFGHHTLRFHSIMPRLRRLFVVVDPHMFLNYNDDDDDDDDEDDDDEMKKLIVEKMENLEQLYLDQRVYGPNVDISDCPKLIFCGCLGWGNSRLRLNNARFYGTECSQVASFASVETFAVHMLAPNLSQLMDFLWCLPCLKTLHIMKISESESWYPASESGTEVALMNTSEGIQCMENTLMKVVLWGFSVDTALEFMQHFINHARFLDSITYTTKESILPPVLDSQFKTLKLGTRKSAKVHVNFACQIKSQVSVYMDYSSHPFGAMLGETYHKISE